MLLSINWARDYLQNQELKINAKELAEKLTMRGLAVGRVTRGSAGLENVVVGRIEKIDPHPDADRLQVTQVVTSGEPGAPKLQIVCGAKNISVGDIVPVALPGAVLPGDFRIKESKIRGVESAGMLCSGKELELSADSDGIMILPKHSTLGEPLSRLLGSDDVVLEFELTPNRPDCLSVIGLVREMAPLLKTRLREPKPARFRVSQHRTSSILKVQVDDANLCARYVARIIDSLRVADSPDWIRQRLQSVGMRPINNIVDITNFVMLEYGQPLHAFDLRRIESGSIRVGTCTQPTDFTLLTGDTVMLEEGDLCIFDGDRPIALAGIMGGANTQIQADTSSIVLESAWFDPARIRKTAKRLGLLSESAKRFEKGVDLDAVAKASERAAALLRDGYDSNVYHPPIDTNEAPIKENVLAVDMRDIRRITGLANFSAEKTSELLESIGISSHKKSANVLNVRLPSYRLDLNSTIDVVEEAARLLGYDNIPARFPISAATYESGQDTQFEFEALTRRLLQRLGLRETIHFSFTSEPSLIKFGVFHEKLVRIQNPISEEMKVMRSSLLPSLLETYAYNRNRGASQLRLFEVARTYQTDESQETGVRETLHVAGLLSGSLLPSDWKKTETPVDFYHAKGLVEALVRQLTTVFLGLELSRSHKLFHPNRSAVLKLGLTEVGFVGEAHPYVREQILETHEPLVLFELNLDALRKYQRNQIHFEAPSKFPPVELDIAITVDKGLTCQTLVETIRTAGAPLLDKSEIFDVYEGDKIPMGKKSVAFHLHFQSVDRTLEEKEVIDLRDKILQTLQTRHGAQLRA